MSTFVPDRPANFRAWLEQNCDMFEINDDCVICTGEALDAAWCYLIAPAGLYEGNRTKTVDFWLTQIWDCLLSEGDDETAILALRDVLLGKQPSFVLIRHYVRRLIESDHLDALRHARADLRWELHQELVNH